VVVGTDLVDVAEVALALERFGSRYLERLFTPHEIATCQEAPALTAQRLAARFAAKEATVKVLRPTEAWIDHREVEVRRAPSGAPSLVLRGEALALARAAGLSQFSVSLSHERAYATAVVAAMQAGPSGPEPSGEEGSEYP
jgi:holo-[acyl-carrier protein] synthase